MSVLTIRYKSKRLHALRTCISILVRLACTKKPPITNGITSRAMLTVSQIFVGMIGRLNRMLGNMIFQFHLSDK